jgi:hypothetical protein
MDTLNDAMYSDSRFVVDALAEFMESVMERHQVATVSKQRMTQVRYIMQVDEDSFRTHITADQLVAIESKEMALILEDLTSAIGLQRFRFADRQSNGNRTMARLTACCFALRWSLIQFCSMCILQEMWKSVVTWLAWELLYATHVVASRPMDDGLSKWDLVCSIYYSSQRLIHL